MFKIRPEHIRTFQPSAEAAFARSVMEYVRTTHADEIVKLPGGEKLIGELNASTLRKMVEGGIAQARRHNINLKSEMISFVTTQFLTAPNFDEHPVAKQILAEAVKIGGQCFERVLDEMTDEHWEEVEKNHQPEAWKTPVEEPKLNGAEKSVETVKSTASPSPAIDKNPIEFVKPIENKNPIGEVKSANEIKPAQKKVVKKPAQKKVLKKQVADASRTQQPAPVAPKQSCPNQNWIELVYKYKDNTAVSGAKYEVFDANTNQSLACGTLDQMGFARVEKLPDDITKVKYLFTSDPKPFEIYPGYKPKSHNMSEATTEIVEEDGKVVSVAKWVGVALAGDFAEDQTLGQIAFGTVVTLIPVVDQVGDVRDIIANYYQLTIGQKYDEFGPWFGLVTTLFGCVPEIGSVVKGMIKAVVSKIGKRLPLPQLMKFMNSVGVGNVVKFLREFLEKIHGHTAEFAQKILKMLDAMKERLEKLRYIAFDKVNDKIKLMLDGIARIYNHVPRKVREVIDHIAKKLKETLDEATDFVMEGVTRARNGAKQVEEKFFKRTAKEFEALAKRAGMKEEQIDRLIKHCHDKDQVVIIRATNYDSLRFQGGTFKYEGKTVECLPKPVTIKLNTAKDDFPEHVRGLVVKPKNPKADQLLEIKELEGRGFTFDVDGVLHDPKGKVFHGDYDVQSVHRYSNEINEAGESKRVLMSEMSNPDEGVKVVDDLNEAIHDGVVPKDHRAIQHGGEADFRKRKNSKDKSILKSEDMNTGGVNGGVMESNKDYKLGRQYGKDEKYIMITPDGAKIIESPEELKAFYKKADLPWEYDNVMPIAPALANLANNSERAYEKSEEKKNKEKK